MTSWALLALLEIRGAGAEACARGVGWLAGASAPTARGRAGR